MSGCLIVLFLYLIDYGAGVGKVSNLCIVAFLEE
jgi:hypothetical protein